MKLAGLLVVLLLTGTAHANPFQAQPAQPAQPRQRAQLKQLLLDHFDRNHDGKLQPRERKQAAKVLRRLAMRLELAPNKQRHRRRFIQRFDRDGDGNVGPGELPPGLADELRPLDRDGDGWLAGDEVP